MGANRISFGREIAATAAGAMATTNGNGSDYKNNN